MVEHGAVNSAVLGSSPSGPVIKCTIMITIRCKECRKELTGTSKVQFCGCPNQMSIVGGKIGAKDLDKVVMVTNNVERKLDSHFSAQELLYQEERRRRKVRRLDFEIR